MKYIISLILSLCVQICSAYGHKDCEHKDCEHHHNKEASPQSMKNDIQYGPDHETSEGVVFSLPWVRTPSTKSKNTAAYFKIENQNSYDIAIKNISSDEDIAERIEVHGYKTDTGEVKKMYKLESILVPGNTAIEFAPGGFHIMLMGLKKEIKKGSEITLKVSMTPSSKLETLSNSESKEFNITFKAN